jgi:hypothetical protein
MGGHTPGPWFVGWMFSPDAPAIIGDGDTVLAIMPGAWNGCSPHPEDARLIAAAPDLLEALIALNADYKASLATIARHYGPITSRLSDAADAAIAKATGESA